MKKKFKFQKRNEAHPALVASEEMLKHIENLQRLSSLMAVERDDFKQSVAEIVFSATYEPESVEKYIHKAKLLLNHVNETGTTPSVHRYPVLRQEAETLYYTAHDVMARQFGLKEHPIVRLLTCSTCKLVYNNVLEMDKDHTHCPKCHSIVKW
jgi:hypothetical protein